MDPQKTDGFIDFEVIGCWILFVYFQKTVSMKEVTSTFYKETTRGFHQQVLFMSPEIVMRIELNKLWWNYEDRTKPIQLLW